MDSGHECWSLPLQILVALCLLYTQVRNVQDIRDIRMQSTRLTFAGHLSAGAAGICCRSGGGAAVDPHQPLAGAANTSGVGCHDGRQGHTSQHPAGLVALGIQLNFREHDGQQSPVASGHVPRLSGWLPMQKLLASIRQVKMGVLESVFAAKVTGARATELRWLARRKYLDAGWVHHHV